MAATPGDTNTNLPSFTGDLSRFLGSSNPDYNGLNSALGKDANARNYDFIYNGQIFRVGGAGDEAGRGIQQTDSVANRQGAQAKLDRMAAIQPAIDSYNATKPEIAAKYDTERTRLEGEKQPLIDRYQNLLDTIKGNQTTAENRQTVTTNSELAKRGLSSDSGVSQQELTNALNPITQQYTGLTKDTAFQREAGLKDINDLESGLTTSQTSDMRALTDAIASLQAGAGNAGVDDKLRLNSEATANATTQAQAAEQKRQFDLQYALQQLQANKTTASSPVTVSEGQSLVDPYTGKVIYNQPKTYKAVAGAAGGGW